MVYVEVFDGIPALKGWVTEALAVMPLPEEFYMTSHVLINTVMLFACRDDFL